MRGLSRWITLCAVCCALSALSGCAAKAPKKADPEFYVTPEGSKVKLKRPCKLSRDGKRLKDCEFDVTILYVVVK